MHSVENSNLFSSVTAAELAEVEGGIVAFEYLLVASMIGLALVVGFSAVTAQHNSVASTSRTVPAVR